MLDIVTLVLGPVETNCYLLADSESKQAVVVDPAWDGARIRAEVLQRGWQLTGLWITHAHFDHIGGAAAAVRNLTPRPLVALHPADQDLYQSQGGAGLFGMRIETPPVPTILLHHGDILQVGGWSFEARHCPGHTPGHVIFVCQAAKVALVGDVIFAGSVGRTDLPGGSYYGLLHSIQTQVLSLPDDTRLYSGHGDVTTVGIERGENPFLN
jgi:glyoxylase-like metal-dependent hydrolase (beta-lactamase superfamily II)